MNFAHRSYEKELLDRVDIPFDAIKRNMHELEIINSNLGGHAITIAGLRQLVKNKSAISICEIGCGGGDNLKAIERWCRKKGIHTRMTGININPDCITIASSKLNDCRLIVSDYRDADFGEEQPDIIFSSLFCHHFTNPELVSMLKWMRAHSSVGFFINDLHRHPLAYHSIKLLTGIFSKSELVKNDAPLSVLRGFRKKEWQQLFHQAGIPQFRITWKWAFRWLIITPQA